MAAVPRVGRAEDGTRAPPCSPDEPVAAHDALVRMIRSWERGDHELTERYELLYRALGLDERADRTAGDREPRAEAGRRRDAARDVMAWITGTNTTDDAIEEMDRAASYLAEVHTRVAAREESSPKSSDCTRTVQALLRSGRQRLRQTRELLRIDSRAPRPRLPAARGSRAAARQHAGTAQQRCCAPRKPRLTRRSLGA